MKLTLIKPTIGRPEHSLYVDEARMEPLNLGVLAALTPPDVDVVMYDDRCETIPYHDSTDLVAITVAQPVSASPTNRESACLAHSSGTKVG